ncbi:MAG: hypothetical protein LBE75_04180 [Burkholderiales bacterium]|jgi:hypothetical protein|nr:hypothetical protein [Burkholderiales bacterium]
MSTPESYTQTVTRCAAGRGWLWWVEAFRMIRESVGPWYGIGLGYICVFILPSILISMMAAGGTWTSIIGYLPTILTPCFVVGFVAAGWTQVRGGTPQFSHLFNGFKADVKTLLGIGAVKMGLWLFTALIFVMVLGSDFETELKSIDTKDPVAVLAFFTSPRLLLAILIGATVLTLTWMADWLSPMVVVFQRAGVVGAMLSSLKALLINWRALAVYVLVPIVAYFAFCLVMGVVVTVLALAALGAGGKSGVLVLLPFLIGGMMLFMPLLISLGTLTAFVAYCDIFHAKDAVFPRPSKRTAL